MKIEGKDGRLALHPDGSRQDVFAVPMTLDTWQKLVGGYVEVQRAVIAGRVVQVLMDEDAIMKGSPVNTAATELLQGQGFNIAPPGLRGTIVIAWGKGKMT